MSMVEMLGDMITIIQPRGPMTKAEALEVAAKLIHLLEDTGFEGVKQAIHDLEQERLRGRVFHNNLNILNERGYMFQHAQDNWVKPGPLGVIVIPRSMLYETSPDDFLRKLIGLEEEVQAVEA